MTTKVNPKFISIGGDKRHLFAIYLIIKKLHLSEIT